MGWGDEIMVTGQARAAQMIDRRPVCVVYDGVRRAHPIWRNNPRFARMDEDGEYQIIVARQNGLRPYASAVSKRRWTWKPYTPLEGEIYFDERETTFGAGYQGRVILEPIVKAAASPNKDWGWTAWERLARLLIDRGERVTQLGPEGTRLLQNVEHIITPDFRSACAVLAHARVSVLPEGGLHHAAAALGVRAVVIFGGFISPAQTGYASHVNIFTGGEACGMREPCGHCAQAMNAITPDAVCDAAMSILHARQTQ